MFWSRDDIIRRRWLNEALGFTGNSRRDPCNDVNLIAAVRIITQWTPGRERENTAGRSRLLTFSLTLIDAAVVRSRRRSTSFYETAHAVSTGHQTGWRQRPHNATPAAGNTTTQCSVRPNASFTSSTGRDATRPPRRVESAVWIKLTTATANAAARRNVCFNFVTWPYSEYLKTILWVKT